MAKPEPSQSESAFTAGKFVVSDTDAKGARDPIALVSQVKAMRTAYRWATGAGLILVAVESNERDEAVRRITAALEGE